MKKLILITVIVITIAACNKIKPIKFDINADSNCVTVTVCPEDI